MSDKLFSIGLIAFGIFMISQAFVDGTYYTTLRFSGASSESDTWTRLMYFIVGCMPLYFGISSLFGRKL